MKLSFRPLAAVVFAACAALVGCGPGSNSPEAVAEKVFKGLFVEQNFEAVKPLVSGDAVKYVESFQKELKEMQERLSQLPPEEQKEFQKEYQAEFQKMKEACANASVVEKTLGDSEATITYRVEGQGTSSLHLVKVDGVWKVDRIDEKQCSNSPEAVAEKVFKGLFVEQNFEAVEPLVSGDAVKYVEEMQMAFKEMPPEYQAEMQAEMQKMKEACANASVVEKTLGDSEATITYRVEGQGTLSLHLVKVDGIWKVDRLDEKR